MPALGGVDDAVGIGAPDQGLGRLVLTGDEAIGGSLEVDDRVEDAALRPALGEPGEDAFDGVEAGAGGRHSCLRPLGRRML